jgi:hypothetical protein
MQRLSSSARAGRASTRVGILPATLALSALLIIPGSPTAVAGSAGAVDFDREVLPILSDKCFRCHGPDAKARKANLRLDVKDSALRKEEPVIVPGKVDESELVARITSDDPAELMPPPKSNLKLDAHQIEVLKRWISQGANWAPHWAFVPLRRPEVPKFPDAGWARNPIDPFIAARLEKEQLHPAPEATRETLVRRLSLDLTGMPPTTGDVADFVSDLASDAYEKLVDRLLASPRFGERIATDWLDLARYADTHGYQMDRPRSMWPWRDWVIRSFNGNQPFDEFVTWQLAGDLLPNPSKEQRLATAFNRLHMQNEEGGIVEEEFRVAYVVDRVTTAGTAFLGLTLECSRCHDHKYDPITQREFYSLFSFFQNIDESGQTTYFTSAMPVPTLLLSDDATDAKLADLNRRIADHEDALLRLRPRARDEFERWLATRGTNKPELPKPVGSSSFEAIEKDKVANEADATKPANVVEGPKLVPGEHGQAAELNGDNGFTFPAIGHFSRVDPFTLSLWLRTPDRAPRAVVVHHSRAPIDAGSRGYELLLESGRAAFGLHHMWPGNSLKVVTRAAIASGTWTHVAVTYDGSSRASGVRIYLDGKPADLEVVRDGLYKDITYEGGEPDLAIGYRFRDSGFKGGSVDDFRVDSRALTPLEIAQLAGKDDLAVAWETPAAELSEFQRDGLFEYFLAHASAPARLASDALMAVRKEQARLINAVPEAMVMKELPRPKPAFMLKRGAYDAPGVPVTANTPAALPPFPSDQPRNRLGLARWLLEPQHPLTARVAVNRLWQMMFGRGLVETSDNFGSQGARPTHPELLDWLANELIASGWDVKHMLRLIATSATYRQSSRASSELLARDPANLLLARGPARRLTAEMLRDQALGASGLLTETMGGPPVRPYQPDGLWDVAMGSPQYNQSHGSDLYRRSLYTFWKRTVPPPAMVTFDAAERNVCLVRRQNTNTPLQALALLNDPQFVEAARQLSARMLKEGGSTDRERVAWMFHNVIGRQPSAKETDVLARLFNEQRTVFEGDRAATAELLTVGESKNDPSLDVVELAAGTVLAEAILNHDDAVMRR